MIGEQIEKFKSKVTQATSEAMTESLNEMRQKISVKICAELLPALKQDVMQEVHYRSRMGAPFFMPLIMIMVNSNEGSPC